MQCGTNSTSLSLVQRGEQVQPLLLQESLFYDFRKNMILGYQTISWLANATWCSRALRHAQLLSQRYLEFTSRFGNIPSRSSPQYQHHSSMSDPWSICLARLHDGVRFSQRMIVPTKGHAFPTTTLPGVRITCPMHSFAFCCTHVHGISEGKWILSIFQQLPTRSMSHSVQAFVTWHDICSYHKLSSIACTSCACTW